MMLCFKYNVSKQPGTHGIVLRHSSYLSHLLHKVPFTVYKEAGSFMRPAITRQNPNMLLLAILSIFYIVAADNGNFCLTDISTRLKTTQCFTGWPGLAAVCPNHPRAGKQHGSISRDFIAKSLLLGYPDNCGPLVHGVQRCTLTIHHLDENTQKVSDYAYLWSDRTIDKDRQPSYTYGGLSWFDVNYSPSSVYPSLTNGKGQTTRLVLAMSSRCRLRQVQVSSADSCRTFHCLDAGTCPDFSS